MAAIGTDALTLADWAKRTDPGGKVDKIVEILNDTNEILADSLWLEANGPDTHLTTTRTGLPSVTWRLLNYGVQPSKSTTVQVKDAIGMLEAYSEVDKDLADRNGNTASFRLSEDKPFLEAMNQEAASTLFYGNSSSDPEKFMGLGPRYAAISTSSTNIGYNIIDAGGSDDDNTSVWLVTWDSSTCHMIFPKGSTAGLNHRDLGEVTLEDSSNGLYQGYRSHYKWNQGLCLRDWRYVVRVANIDVSDMGTTSTGPNLIEYMIDAHYRLPSQSMGKKVWYANRTVMSYLHKKARSDDNVNLTVETVEGKPVTKFLGIPVRQCDAILNTESAVS